MTAPRIYSPGQKSADGAIELGKEDLHYIKTVLRLKPKDRITVFDGGGCEYETIIDRFTPASVVLTVSAVNHVQELPVRITLAQSLPKERKMDLIVQKATELGVWRIIPFISSRTVPRLTAEKRASRTDRWRKIASEASKQCLRAHVPEIGEIVSYPAMLDQANSQSLNIIFWEEEATRGIKDIFNDASSSKKQDIMVVIGPEGGFSRDEAAMAQEKGFLAAHLGRQILRVETASLAVMAIIQYERGLIGSPVTGKE